MHKLNIQTGACKTINKNTKPPKPKWTQYTSNFPQAKWINNGPSSEKSLAQQRATKPTENQSTAAINNIELLVASQKVNNSMILEKQELFPQLPSFSSFVTPLPQDNEEHNVPPIFDIIYNLLQHGRDAPQLNESLPPILLPSQDNYLPPLGELIPDKYFNDNYAE